MNISSLDDNMGHYANFNSEASLLATRHCLTPTRTTIIRQTDIITSVGEDVGKLEPSDIADGNVNGATSLAVPQKVQHRATL